MILSSCTFGFNIFTIFNFYNKTNSEPKNYNFFSDTLLSILWMAIYSVPPLTVIFVGAFLRRYVSAFNVEKLFHLLFLRKGRETGIIIHKTIRLTSDKATVKQVSILHQLLINFVNFLWNVNWILIGPLAFFLNNSVAHNAFVIMKYFNSVKYINPPNNILEYTRSYNKCNRITNFIFWAFQLFFPAGLHTLIRDYLYVHCYSYACKNPYQHESVCRLGKNIIVDYVTAEVNHKLMFATSDLQPSSVVQSLWFNDTIAYTGLTYWRL